MAETRMRCNSQVEAKIEGTGDQKRTINSVKTTTTLLNPNSKEETVAMTVQPLSIVTETEDQDLLISSPIHRQRRPRASSGSLSTLSLDEVYPHVVFREFCIPKSHSRQQQAGQSSSDEEKVVDEVMRPTTYLSYALRPMRTVTKPAILQDEVDKQRHNKFTTYKAGDDEISRIAYTCTVLW